MQLTEQQITKFQAIYKTRFNKQLSRKEALEKGIKLARMMQIIYRPITKEQYQQLQTRNSQTENL
ncbi:hypothetical protein COT64_02015 [Candidatus Shapirobacteria bacterium CG09_land_8_20_14_0_10_39_12]|uniref:Uncharacterized protein n=1 Tax=Candidatus Shapirobacteria bacterium CG09_land_8_20_14_0_10_39_12 TaxID=1974885 RepID=A0A2H0WPH8_9BACT|nr:MAG: hypothetical protein COT64_02015 [Candidatus Shapirobacteria bacterium CG09_land_8_20_14_0_10_39_12]